MAAHLTVLLILTGLAGVHSVTTIPEVSVKVRNSITIPCLYEAKYTHNLKYLCKGYNWNFCKTQIKTNGHSSKKYSISDDKNQRIFTVTIRDLTNEDAHYWCIVEINNGGDDGKYFHLSVTGGIPALSVDRQEIAGFNGESVSIDCTSGNSGRNEMNWCRLGGKCVKAPSGSIAGTNVIISAVYNVFTVTMSGLTTGSSGWYYCEQGNSRMPVHVTVTERPSTSTLTTFSTTVPPSLHNPVVAGNSAFLLKILVIPLGVLFFTVIVALFIWFMLKKRKEIHTKTLTTARAEEETAYCNVGCTRGRTSIQRSHAENDMDVTYSTVVTKKTARKTHAENEMDMTVTYSSVVTKKQPVRKAHAENDLDLTYSSVVTQKNPARTVGAQDNDVTYSTVAQTHQNI